MKKTALKLASLAILCNFYLPMLVQNFSILSDTWILVQNCQMVTFTIIGTCHHEVNLARVNSFNNTFSNIKWRNQLAHNSLMVKSWNTSTFCFCSLPILSFNFLKIYQMVICPVRRTYNHGQIFFASEWKNRVKTSKSSNILQLLYPYICLIFRNSLRYLNFRPQLSDGDMYKHWYMSPRL